MHYEVSLKKLKEGKSIETIKAEMNPKGALIKKSKGHDRSSSYRLSSGEIG